ncbi:DinB family protein [Croceivirga sp. JEA036]|uniref:DinB family protein n=1 Tax=Croceivirga sp. JEA036 TaxID=2721162 RepID=UPI00143C4754|nr:DinB family protein [Croceivirga sp. JEA036]NJB35752.1 DinB family protein [Croceivirga sp. JEA036]
MPQEEYWLSGPVPDIPVLAQPAAHALLQTQRELKEILLDFPKDKLWKKIGERASVGFHAQHLTGVLDRLLTYAQEKSLTEEQFLYLKSEGEANEKYSPEVLVENFEQKVTEALAYFKTLTEAHFTAPRFVGRKRLATNVLGLIFHAAEHSQRHLGQLLVTASILIEKPEL